MKEKEIKRLAKKLNKALKGKADFVSIEEHLKTLGYKVIFFNTPVGDKEIIRYNLMLKAEKVDAFTYTSAAKIVFINNDCSGEEKLYLLYHEVGHILLGHMDYPRLSTRNKVLLDIETDVFAYNIIHPPKSNGTFIYSLILIIALLTGSFFTPKTKSIPVSTIDNSIEYVCITATGDKYHREYCSHIHDGSAHIARSEAKKLFEPCSNCNPQ